VVAPSSDVSVEKRMGEDGFLNCGKLDDQIPSFGVPQITQELMLAFVSLLFSDVGRCKISPHYNKHCNYMFPIDVAGGVFGLIYVTI
jgi:hypothetical protein